MATIQELYTQSSLSLAAYADLTKGALDTPTQKAALEKAGMAAAQAADFATKWTVVDQYNGITGVSATVFKNIEQGSIDYGKSFLAIRGTEPEGVDFAADFILAVGFIPLLNPQYIQLRDAVNVWINSTKDGGDVILPDGITITGHSLGGYLAVALGSPIGCAKF